MLEEKKTESKKTYDVYRAWGEWDKVGDDHPFLENIPENKRKCIDSIVELSDGIRVEYGDDGYSEFYKNYYGTYVLEY